MIRQRHDVQSAPPIPAEDLQDMRARMRESSNQWILLPEGGMMELIF
jgi:hypothetical protein